MIDIHCHILPAVDDGPAFAEASLRMCRMAADDGITHIAATPHFSYGGKPSADDIRLAGADLESALESEGIPVKLVTGADIRLTFELIGGIERKDIPTINGSRYFLLELPDVIPPNVERIFFVAAMQGFIPIVTHPERNQGLLSRPEKIGQIREAGALFQLTAMSITGEFEQQARMFSLMLLKKGFADFVASDAHDPLYRKPVLSRAYREVADGFGEGEARRIFLENPSAVLENRPLS